MSAMNRCSHVGDAGSVTSRSSPLLSTSARPREGPDVEGNRPYAYEQLDTDPEHATTGSSVKHPENL
eukprot:10164478-Karenia_brevis.AAC.1